MPLLHPMLFQNPGLPYGDTRLHQSIRSFQSMADVNQLIADIGEEVAAYMATVTNDEGELPIDLLESEVPVWHRDYDDLYNKLLALMTPKQYRKIEEPMDRFDPSSTKGLPQVRRLNRNMRVGIEIAECVRSIILGSSTHPQANSYTQTKFESVVDEINAMRTIISFKFREQFASKFYHQAKHTTVGNCAEFSYCALHLLSKHKPQLYGEVIAFTNGDHVVLLIDRVADSDLNRPETWGNAAVVCDAWMGEVYPAAEMPYRMKNYQNYSQMNGEKRQVNTLSTYNPRFHQFELKESNAAVKKKSSHIGLFAVNEKARTASEACEERPGKRSRKK